MNSERFYEYDVIVLKETRDRLWKILSFYFGDRKTKRLWRRLGTIITKLNELIQMNEE